MCWPHYRRWLKHGDALATPLQPQTEIERFNQFFRKADDGCWYWTRSQNSAGYGRFSTTHHGKGWELAHRSAYRLFRGSVGRACVLLTCDHKMCVNPLHLYLGTQVDNVRDCYARGQLKVGEGSSQAKLTDADVLSMRALWRTDLYTQRTLAAMFACSRTNVSLIVTRKHWRHLP